MATSRGAFYYLYQFRIPATVSTPSNRRDVVSNSRLSAPRFRHVALFYRAWPWIVRPPRPTRCSPFHGQVPYEVPAEIREIVGAMVVSRREAKTRIQWLCVVLSLIIFLDETMWRTPNGDKTFTGPYALMLARGLRIMVNGLLEAIHDDEEEYQIGYRVFDSLTTEQQIWTLHQVAYGLLDEKTPVCELTAFGEATIAGMFRALEDAVEMEIGLSDESDEIFADVPDGRFSWRKTMLVPYELAGGNAPENLGEDETPLTFDCDDEERWGMVSEILEADVLWDADYELDSFDDLDPKEGAILKEMFRIGDDYYSSIPQDPKRPAAKKLLKATADLCDTVAKREEKAIKLSKRKRSK